MQGYKVVGIARQVSAHGAALDAGCIDAIAQFQGNLQDHVFFFGAVGANGTGVFAAMACIDGHNDQTIGD